MKFINEIHESSVHRQRVESLTHHLLGLLPRFGTVLDVGCGDGLLAGLLAKQAPHTEFRAIDVIVREEHFDGRSLHFFARLEV